MPLPAPKLSAWGRVAPPVALILLAPLIGEVLSGATRMSFIFALVPEIMVWGCGALIIRETVRRWGGGWTSILLLGLALSVAEEFVIQQTSLAPLPWAAESPGYGRLWGINWVYFLFMLGYESVWIALVPIQLTELLFPERRNAPWLKRLGLIISGVVFVFGSYIAWFAWTQRARPIVFHAPNYQPAVGTVLLGLIAIVLLALVAYTVSEAKPKQSAASGNAPTVWIVGAAALAFGFPWYVLMAPIFSPTFNHAFPFWIFVLAGYGWASLVFLIIRHWTATSGWEDMHRWALVSGATVVCMVAGFSGSSTWPRGDVIGKAVLNVIAVLGLVLLAWRIQRRRATVS
ncbi:MAG: hypothetical protein WAN13_10875 [Candidatus Acidiferrales bacterium]